MGEMAAKDRDGRMTLGIGALGLSGVIGCVFD